MHREAVRLGMLYVEKERALDQAFVERKIGVLNLNDLISQIGGLRAQIRVAHLHSHLKMERILSPAQVRAYDELRGYSDEGRNSHKRKMAH